MPLSPSAWDGAGGLAACQLPCRPKVPGLRSQLDFEDTSEWFRAHKPWTPQAHPPLHTRRVCQPWGLRAGLVCLPKMQTGWGGVFSFIEISALPFCKDA